MVAVDDSTLKVQRSEQLVHIYMHHAQVCRQATNLWCGTILELFAHCRLGYHQKLSVASKCHSQSKVATVQNAAPSETSPA
jgi:hypothetical protein